MVDAWWTSCNTQAYSSRTVVSSLFTSTTITWSGWQPVGVMLGQGSIERGRWDESIGNYNTIQLQSRSVWEGTSGKGEPLLERGYWGRFLKLQYQILYLLHLLCAGHCARAVGTYEPSGSISQVVGLVKTPGSHEQKPNSASQATKINLF